MILKNKKGLFASLAICLIIALFSVLTFEALHSGHEAFCHEEDCPVCIVLQIIRANKKTSPAAHAEAAEFISFFYINVIILSALLFVPATLVKQKVKLVI
ncbi:hypothetical protein MSI_04880 [Treponema sp. JC4]|uniref:hypothetical protein n=1 Tax=Treponema sp. JC4 TaxID=1124982 RepID=UPI00025B0494|nr:hypothetical protein [Treponema sp. JC4]EID85669.1 hypothetical protein MSI_04880 [Treponema sp. JC4]